MSFDGRGLTLTSALVNSGVVPAHQASHDAVLQQRKQQCADLREALVATRRVTDATSQPEVLLHMYLIEKRQLPLDPLQTVKTCHVLVFRAPCSQVGITSWK